MAARSSSSLEVGGKDLFLLLSIALAKIVRRRHTFPLAPIPPGVGPQCSQNIHPELFPSRQRLLPHGRTPQSGAHVDGTNGEVTSPL